MRSVKFKTGNREDGPAFQWIPRDTIYQVDYPDDAYVLDRISNLNFFGRLTGFELPGLEVPDTGELHERLAAALAALDAERLRTIAPIEAEETPLANELNYDIKYQLINLRYRKRQIERRMADATEAPESRRQALAELESAEQTLVARENELKDRTDALSRRRLELEAELRRNAAVFVDAAGRERRIALVDIVRFWRPNSMGIAQKARHYAAKAWELVSDDPREANQDGGVFPAIMGTVLLVFLMAILCFPLGVLAGIYLGEYAKEGPLVRMVRIAVNNLAGIPSIVYGIFGLGFFIYLVGGNLDRWLFPAMVDASEPVLGKGAVLWASLTLGLLTIPVVIVSTEEALRQIPRGVREGSYALGATKFQTLCRVLVPMASPGMMTGFILAMARAAGEVAPLMITGAVKDAPSPIDGVFPYLHVDRSFMHLGFHIFDISCKSPNVEATKPLVYVTTLLLLLIVLTMTSTAIYVRNKMRKRYQSRAI